MIEPSGRGRFAILGPLEIWMGDDWAPISAPKWRALLALLLLQAGRPVATDVLIDGVWPDGPPARAANLVSVYVHRLRRLLGDEAGTVIVTRAPGYQVALNPGDLDAERFSRLAADGRRALAAGEPESAARLLAGALGEWRGPALADVPASPLVTAEADRLEEARIAALESRITADLACGRAAEVTPELRRLLADHPLREDSWALLMRALHRAGRHAEALEAYARAREVIAGELGVDPGPGLRQLHEEILRGDAVSGGAVAPVAGGAVAPGAGGAVRGPAGGTGGVAARGDPPGAGEGAAVAGGGGLDVGGPGPAAPEAGGGGPRVGGPGVGDAGAAAPEAGGGGPGVGGPGVGDAGAAAPEAGGGVAAPAEAADGGAPRGSDGPVTGHSAVPGDPGLPRPAQLPADIPDFTGREARVGELRRLLTAQDRQGSPGAVPVVVVVGSGGLGKTTLAVHAAHLLAGDYPDGQLHVNLLGATDPADPADVLARFLRDLGVEPARIPAGADERAARYRTLLSGRRVLVVLDDARDAAQVSPLLPGSASCAVLITGRGRLTELVGSSVIDLDVLPPQDARVLFARIAGPERADAEPAATQEVLAACAGLPLAIRIAAARLVARGGWNVHYLADRLSDERRRLDELRTGNLAVRASFEVSFASLGGPALAGGVAPAHAFRLLGVWTGPSIGLPAACALLGRPEPDVTDALEVLVDAHLLDSPGPDRYRFHDLLRVYAADRARAQETGDDRQQAITRLLTWYLHTTEAAARVISSQRTQVPLGPLPPRVHPVEFASLEEALAWCETERASLVPATRLAAASGLHEIAWKLPAAAMSFFYRRSHWVDWVTTHETGLVSARQSGDRVAEAWLLTNLGMAFGQQRKEESVTCFEQALTLSRELGNVNGEVRAANNLANACLDLGRFGDAWSAAQRSLDIQRRAGNRYGEGLALGTLGCACRELGRPGEAVPHLRQALAIFRELGHADAEADALSDLGDTYLALGRPADAIACLHDSLALRRAVGNRYGQAATLHRLGQAHERAGDHRQARVLLAEALEVFDDLGDAGRSAEIRGEMAGIAGHAC